MAERQCPFCGKLLRPETVTCPFCRADLPLPTAEPSAYRSIAGNMQIRRGALYMLLAAVLYYFAAGYSTFELPVSIAPILTDWALPLLFLGGLGLTVYGMYCRFTG